MRRLAASIFVSVAVSQVLSVWLSAGSKEGPAAAIVVGVWLVAMAGIGALIASKRVENPIGWLMLAMAGLLTLHGLAGEYASYVLERGHALPFGEFAAWLSLWLVAPGAAGFIPLLFVFPTGRLISRRWRWALWGTAIGTLVTSIGMAIKPGPVDYVRKIDNPLGVEPAAISTVLGEGGSSLLTGLGLLAAGSLVLRYRRSTGTERQQIKWFVYAVVMMPVLSLVAIPVDAVDGDGASYGAFAVNMTAALLIPISLGVAILRGRLYDIDVVINRTLVYVALTGLLAGTYLGSVVLLQSLLVPLTADSDVAVAGSTLAVAALFGPLRSRVQDFIDKRFYRRKYDAAETLGRFSGRLREEIELEALSEDLISVVGETVQPSHASLWLRSEGAR